MISDARILSCYSPKILILVATRFCNWSILPDAIICNLFEYINFSKNNPICQISDFKIPGVLSSYPNFEVHQWARSTSASPKFPGQVQVGSHPLFFPLKWPNFNLYWFFRKPWFYTKKKKKTGSRIPMFTVLNFSSVLISRWTKLDTAIWKRNLHS